MQQQQQQHDKSGSNSNNNLNNAVTPPLQHPAQPSSILLAHYCITSAIIVSDKSKSIVPLNPSANIQSIFKDHEYHVIITIRPSSSAASAHFASFASSSSSSQEQQQQQATQRKQSSRKRKQSASTISNKFESAITDEILKCLSLVIWCEDSNEPYTELKESSSKVTFQYHAHPIIPASPASATSSPLSPSMLLSSLQPVASTLTASNLQHQQAPSEQQQQQQQRQAGDHLTITLSCKFKFIKNGVQPSGNYRFQVRFMKSSVLTETNAFDIRGKKMQYASIQDAFGIIRQDVDKDKSSPASSSSPAASTSSSIQQQVALAPFPAHIPIHQFSNSSTIQQQQMQSNNHNEKDLQTKLWNATKQKSQYSREYAEEKKRRRLARNQQQEPQQQQQGRKSSELSFISSPSSETASEGTSSPSSSVSSPLLSTPTASSPSASSSPFWLPPLFALMMSSNNCIDGTAQLPSSPSNNTFSNFFSFQQQQIPLHESFACSGQIPLPETQHTVRSTRRSIRIQEIQQQDVQPPVNTSQNALELKECTSLDRNDEGNEKDEQMNISDDFEET